MEMFIFFANTCQFDIWDQNLKFYTCDIVTILEYLSMWQNIYITQIIVIPLRTN